MTLKKSIEGLEGLTQASEQKQHRNFLIIPIGAPKMVEFTEYRIVGENAVVPYGFFQSLQKYYKDDGSNPTVTCATQKVYDKFKVMAEGFGVELKTAHWVKKRGRPSGKKEEDSQ